MSVVPAVARTEAVAGDEVMVVLSKPVDAPDALTLARYDLEPEVEILDATLGETATEVHLHTAPLEPIAYTLAVRDPRDADGYGLLADHDQATFEGQRRDCDCDGLTDGLELFTYGTDPMDPDTDGDGIPDGEDDDPTSARSVGGTFERGIA